MPGADLSVVSAYFTIYAYEALKPQLDGIGSLRFLFGEPRFLRGLDPDKIDKKAFDIEENGLNLQNRLQQRAVARACSEWLARDSVEVRSIIKPGFLHGKLYHVNNNGVKDAILGSSNFTLAGLGLGGKPNLELNLIVDSGRDKDELWKWFDTLWKDGKVTEDVKQQVLDYLSRLYDNYSPQFVYFKTLYHVFDSFLHQNEQRDAFGAETHLYDTAIWNSLFEFQKHGVSGLINRIRRHNGAILADSVGLGKTYEALAVIKYFENLNGRVLVLCPKKLRDNWTIYQSINASQLNPFLRDRFGYTVLSHTDLSREGGKSGDIDLGTFNWGAFDLVVIDESHNFRNNARGKRDEEGNPIRKTRYERLIDDIVKAGVPTKVLLLSATPVNNDLQDLRNQIYLLTGDRDGAFAQSLGISSLREALISAQRAFADWAKKDGNRSASALMENLPSAFFKLMDELTIARSRRHITRHYANSLEEIGAFPERATPDSRFPDIDITGEFLSYDDINDLISGYQLALFSPFSFVRDDKKHLYEETQVRNFSQERREHFLVGMMKVNFLKRLESSVSSFAITLKRTLDKIESLQTRISEFEKQFAAGFVIPSIDTGEGEEELSEAFQIGTKNYDLRHFRLQDWKDALGDDWAKLNPLYESATKVCPERDQKLQELKQIIREKVENPPLNVDGEANRKILVFTAFSDTATYLYDNLSNWARKELGLESALVTGGGATKATWGAQDFASILVNFSPKSKQRARLSNWALDNEINLLIATDCISEGQNLQDCDLVVNYDIHWNPVRLIQRFGRIDRIGTRNERVGLVNFWPTPDLNRYINLKNRVEARMALVDVAATTEDNLLSGQGAQGSPLEELIQDDLRYRDKQLLRLKDEILDLEDMNETASLDEFTLDDFRQELLAYLNANKDELRDAPLGIYAIAEVPAGHPQLKPGVVWCLRRRQNVDQEKRKSIGSARVNPLEPYFLVYNRDDGTVRFTFTQPKLVLEAWRLLCQGQAQANEALCELFDRETHDGADMGRYNELLKGAYTSIKSGFEKRNARQISLLGGRGGTLAEASQGVRQITDFELVTWCIVKNPVSLNKGGGTTKLSGRQRPPSLPFE